MKQLFLLRHAKAVKADGFADDRDRPLAPEGLADIAAGKDALVGRADFRPAQVLCSPAIRTQQTLEALAANTWLADVETVFEPSIYLALASHLFALVGEQPKDCDSLLIVGHNPGLHQLAVSLARHGSAEQLRALGRIFPPFSLVALHFDVPRWQDVSVGSGTLRWWQFPERYQVDAA